MDAITEDAHRLDAVAGLLAGLADRGVLDGLAGLDLAPGERNRRKAVVRSINRTLVYP
jgi:hypothetical protein